MPFAVQGVGHFIQEYLYNEVWMLAGSEAYGDHEMADVGTAELRPFELASTAEEAAHAPNFQRMCPAFNGRHAVRCPAGAACELSRAPPRVWI
jgi:hypothetical protein